VMKSEGEVSGIGSKCDLASCF